MSKKRRKTTRQDLEQAMRDLKPGEAYEVKDSRGRVVATLGVPSAQPAAELPSVESGSRDTYQSTWLD